MVRGVRLPTLLSILFVSILSINRIAGEHSVSNYELSVNLCTVGTGSTESNITCTSNSEIRHFWKSTGLSPPEPRNATHEFLLSADEKFNLALIAALPHNGIQQVRIHWLLYLIRYNSTTNEYDFHYLDAFLDLMHDHGLHVGFELMGLPLNMAPDDAMEDIHGFWYNLTYSIAARYTDRYSYEEVQHWRFESMNEPDLKQYNFLNFTLNEYLQYVNACSSALRAVGDMRQEMRLQHNSRPHKSGQLDHRPHRGHRTRTNTTAPAAQQHPLLPLKFGAPGGLFKARDHHPLCWGLLDMCNATWQPPPTPSPSDDDADETTTMSTLSSMPANGCQLQYVSLHKKGGGSARQVLADDLAMLDTFRAEYPFMQHMPLANDEADILTNWSLDEEWRADVRYAALMAKVIIQHYKAMVVARGVRLEVLSNDNGFMNYHPHYFTQRTLLARFQMNNTTPRHVQFIRKPVYAAMGLLSMLGNEYMPIENSQHCEQLENDPDSRVHILTSRRTTAETNVVSIIAVAANDNISAAAKPENWRRTRSFKNISISLRNFINENDEYSKVFIAIYVLDSDKTNPYRVWRKHKSPAFPDIDLRRKLRKAEEPARLRFHSLQCIENTVQDVVFSLLLKLPSIYFINVCINPDMNIRPGKVVNLRGYHVTNGEVLLTWSDRKIRSRCIKTYEVEYQNSTYLFNRINAEDIIFLSYQHDSSDYGAAPITEREEIVRRASRHREQAENRIRYRVRAIDYWNRPGKYSNVITDSDIIHL